jgi:hypothetical protein
MTQVSAEGNCFERFSRRSPWSQGHGHRVRSCTMHVLEPGCPAWRDRCASSFPGRFAMSPPGARPGKPTSSVTSDNPKEYPERAVDTHQKIVVQRTNAGAECVLRGRADNHVLDHSYHDNCVQCRWSTSSHCRPAGILKSSLVGAVTSGHFLFRSFGVKRDLAGHSKHGQQLSN